MNSIVIAAGHSHAYQGVSKNDHFEFTECEKIVAFLKPKLEKENYKVDVVYGKLIDKVNKINEIDPDIAIEIHLGNVNNNRTSGSRSFYMLNDNDSKDLANYLLDTCVQELQTENKGSYVAWYKKISPSMVEKGKAPEDWKVKIDLFVSKTNCTAAIVEPFYISSEKDCEDFIDSEAHEEIADAIVLGVKKYFNNRVKNSLNI